MLVNRKRKLIILTPFKNYSSTLEEIFNNSDWEKIYGAHPKIEGENYICEDLYHKHNNIVSEIFLKKYYKVILPVRNPYERVNSMWKHSKTVFPETNFYDWFFENSKCACCLPVTRTYRYDHLIRVEFLKEDLDSLDIKIDHVPQLNKSITIAHEFSSIEKEQIYYLHYEDFKNGNYPK